MGVPSIGALKVAVGRPKLFTPIYQPTNLTHGSGRVGWDQRVGGAAMLTYVFTVWKYSKYNLPAPPINQAYIIGVISMDIMDKRLIE